MNRQAGRRFILLMLCCLTASAATLNSLVVQTQGGMTSAVFSFNNPFEYKSFTLSNPHRVVVDLKRTRSMIQVRQLAKGDPLITHIRSGYPGTQTLRIVFDVKRAVQIKTIASVRQLRIHFIEKKDDSKSNVAKTRITQSTVNHHSPKPLRDVVIILDPGHGGKDPGAIGRRGTAEKNIVLAIALKLKKIIDKQPGMRAVLTRDGDYYVGLRERLNIARKHDADVFISIHADAFINKHSNGASVFALSQRGATSEAARWLAEKENYSELGGVDLSELDDKNGLVRSVLIDLSQTATISASLQMGSWVLKNMDKITDLHHEKVEQARFVVLKSPDIPSILVETGFISNAREEKNLINPAYQARLTQAIFNGVKRYFWEHPPDGTRIAAMSGVNKHVVKVGESLSVIAARYHTTVRAIKAHNHLSSDRIKVGQKLGIPSSWS